MVSIDDKIKKIRHTWIFCSISFGIVSIGRFLEGSIWGAINLVVSVLFFANAYNEYKNISMDKSTKN